MHVTRTMHLSWRAPRPAVPPSRRGRGIVLVAVLLAGCADATTAPRVYHALTLCGLEWLAYRNEGETWVRAEGAGRFAVTATERLAVADARLDARSPLLRVQYLTAAQARDAFRCSSAPSSPNPAGTVHGAVAGLRADEIGYVSYGSWAATVTADAPNFTLVPLAGADLLAARVAADGGVATMIARRDYTLVDGAKLTLDFGSAEAFTPSTANLRWHGTRAHLQVHFRTAAGNELLIQSQVLGEAGGDGVPQSATMRGLPTSQLRDGDAHYAALGSAYAAADQRQLRVRFRDLRDLTVQHGPPASQPVFTRLATVPHVRLRATIPVVAEYAAGVSLTLQQDREMGSAQANRVVVTLSATWEYLGRTPGTWSLEIPDLWKLPGFGTFDGLHDAPFRWGVVMYNEAALRPDSLLVEGQLARSASTNGTGR